MLAVFESKKKIQVRERRPPRSFENDLKRKRSNHSGRIPTMPAPFRADHVGSFLRPADLLEARSKSTPDQLRQLEDEHILRVLARQKDLGFEIVTDGELRRRNFMSDFTDAVDGFDMSGTLGR